MSGEKAAGSDGPLPVLAGRYQLKRVIARGGMGEIWEAEQIQLQRKVAIKLINPHSGQGWEELVKRFGREATALARLNHVNVVTIYDHGETEDGHLFIAMEFLEGKTLAELIANEGPLDFPRVAHLGVQICRGLREAHAAGLIHRDLKLSNVLIISGGSDESERDHVKVVDFGLAKFQATRDPAQRGEITAGEVLLGSPKYMSPEQICGDPVDERSDVYAVGVLLYAMVTGALPYDGGTTAEIIRKHLKDPPPPFASVGYGRNCPPALSKVIHACLEKEPPKRPATAKELISGLKEAYRSVVSPSFDPAEARAMGLEDADVSAPPRARMLSESGWRTVNDLSPDTSVPAIARPMSEVYSIPPPAGLSTGKIAAAAAGVVALVGLAFLLGRSDSSADPGPDRTLAAQQSTTPPPPPPPPAPVVPDAGFAPDAAAPDAAPVAEPTPEPAKPAPEDRPGKTTKAKVKPKADPKPEEPVRPKPKPSDDIKLER